MASNMLSRLFPSTAGEPSIYETLQQQDEESAGSDMEERVSIALDEENLGIGFKDFEMDDALGDDATSQLAGPSNLDTGRQSQGGATRSVTHQRRLNTDDLDDEVPQSLLIEDGRYTAPQASARPSQAHAQALPPPVPGPASRGTRAKWQSTQDRQRLHDDVPPSLARTRATTSAGHTMGLIDPKEKALWLWANVENLDNFLQDVYDYFVGNGIWCIFLSRLLNLLYVHNSPPDLLCS